MLANAVDYNRQHTYVQFLYVHFSCGNASISLFLYWDNFIIKITQYKLLRRTLLTWHGFFTHCFIQSQSVSWNPFRQSVMLIWFDCLPFSLCLNILISFFSSKHLFVGCSLITHYLLGRWCAFAYREIIDAHSILAPCWRAFKVEQWWLSMKPKASAHVRLLRFLRTSFTHSCHSTAESSTSWAVCRLFVLIQDM
jgi:hypothetical protein